jgi:flagellar FliL protein
MKKTKTLILIAGIALVSAGLAAGAVWRITHPDGAPGQAARKAEGPKKPAKYITLDKVIVMLRRGPNDNQAHYLSADLVLATSEEKEKNAKEHLPLLRSIAVRTLSAYGLPEASAMTVEQYAALLNKSFDASYARERLEKPFAEVMIGKLIIE